MGVGGATFGILGALAAFPRRLAARQVKDQGGVLRRGVTRKTTHVVFGRKLLDAADDVEIEARYDAAIAAGQQVLSETGFLRLLGLAPIPPSTGISTSTLREQSCLDARILGLLAVFDAFEHGGEPWSFRDLILARKYAGLIAGGAGWHAIARSVHRSGAVASLTALSLHAGDEAVYARHGEALSELDGQSILPLQPATDEVDPEDLFDAAEAAEAGGDHEGAAALYRRCLAADPDDSVTAFNLANALRASGSPNEAIHSYAQAIKGDPGFVEAWFNLAGLLSEQGKADAARRHLLRAVAIDSDYADAIYNLATLEFDAGRLEDARRWWTRYLELDNGSDWARTALRGIQFVDLTLAARNGTR